MVLEKYSVKQGFGYTRNSRVKHNRKSSTGIDRGEDSSRRSYTRTHSCHIAIIIREERPSSRRALVAMEDSSRRNTIDYCRPVSEYRARNSKWQSTSIDWTIRRLADEVVQWDPLSLNTITRFIESNWLGRSHPYVNLPKTIFRLLKSIPAK